LPLIVKGCAASERASAEEADTFLFARLCLGCRLSRQL
jgi:hypothetical protein